MNRHWPRLFDKPATCLSLLLVALALLPALDTTVRYYYHQESYNNYKEQLPEAVELSGGQEFIQKINIKGLFTRLAICLDTYGRENSGNIEISIIKDGRQIHSRSLPMSSLKAGRQVLELGDWWKPRHIQDPVELKIRASGGVAGSSAGLVLSNGLYYGQLTHGGQILQKNLLVAVNSRTVPPLSLIRLGLFVAIAVLVQLAIVSISSPRPNERWLFWLSFFIILLSLCHKFPLSTFMAEPSREAGSNFFKMTAEYPWRESVFIKDFAYWPLFQRLITKFYMKVFGRDEWTFLFMYMTMTALLAAVCSMFCLKAYKRYMKKEFRFICCVFLGLTPMVASQVTMFFINAVYFGLLYLFMIAMLDLNALSRRVYALVLLSGIICISKAHYILLMPFALACLAYCLIKRKNRRLGLFAAVIFITSTTQFAYIMLIDSSRYGICPEHTILITSERTLYFFTNVMMKFFSVSPTFDLAQQSGYIWHFTALCVIVIIFLYCMRQIVARQYLQTSIIILTALALAFASLFLTVRVHCREQIYNFVLWRDIVDFWLIGNQQLAFVCICLTMVVIMFFSLIAKWPKGEWLLCFLFMVYMIPRAQTIDNDMNAHGFERSDWHEYYPSFRSSSYVIPMRYINFIAKNAELLYAGSSQKINHNVASGTGRGIGWREQWITAKPVKLLNDADNTGSRADLSDVAELCDRNIIALYAKKTGSTQTAEVTAVFRDRNNAILTRVPAANGDNRLHIGFIPDEPIKNMAWLEFVDQDDFPVDMPLDYYFGVEKF